MSTAVIENIAANIKTAIDEITVANGYNQDLSANRPRRKDFADASWNDLDVIISQGPAEKVPGGIGTVRWLQTFLLSAIVIDSDDATAAIDTRLNQVASDIFKKLAVDTTRGGLAIDTNIESAIPFVDEDSALSGIAVMIEVDYRTAENDPYTQA